MNMRRRAYLVLLLIVGPTFGLLTPADASMQNKWGSLKFVSGFFGLDSARERSTGHAELSIVGAGFARTGTKSLEAALIQCGHKVYDTRSMLENKHTSRWVDAAKQWRADGNLTLVRQLVGEMEAAGYTATLDYPMNILAQALSQVKPDAQVIMSVRESEQKWVEAWGAINDILSVFVLRPWKWLVSMDFPGDILMAIYDFDHPTPRYPESVDRPLPWWEVAHVPHLSFRGEAQLAAWVELHRRHRGALEAALPPQRFLAFDVREGWGPLVAFLHPSHLHAVPDTTQPFPNVNDRSSMQMVRRVMDVTAAGLPVWALVVLLGAVRGLRALVNCMRSGSTSSAKHKRS